MTTPRLLYENGPLFAVWKPPGKAVQAPPQFPSLEAEMKEWLRKREGKSGNVYLGVPHRLDRPVSGVVLFTRHVRAARKVSTQFEHRTVRKIYWAVVAGRVTPPEGTWTDFVRKTYGRPQAEIVAAGAPGAQQAVLHYRMLDTVDLGPAGVGTRLEIELETGRTHQIRLQASSRGSGVVGDAFYGSTVPFGPQDVDDRARHIALHARSIALRHPMTDEPIEITARVPASWRALRLPLAEAEYCDD